MEKLGRYQVQRKVEAAGGPLYVGSEANGGRTAELRPVRFTAGASSDKLASSWRNPYDEVCAAVALQHPNIAEVYEIFQHEGQSWVASEVASGQNLAARLAEGTPLDEPAILELLRQTADALDYAHGTGLLHRALRPANIEFPAGGAARVYEFGLTQYFLDAPEAGNPGDRAYLAPELIRNERLTNRCDQFSLAAIAYEMLTGEAPFQGSAEQIRSAIVEQDPLPADGLNPVIGPAAARALARGLAKRPAERYSSCREFVGALQRALALAPGWRTGDADPLPPGPVEAAPNGPQPIRAQADRLVDDLVAELASGPEQQTGETHTAAAVEKPSTHPLPSLPGGRGDNGAPAKLPVLRKHDWQLELAEDDGPDFSSGAGPTAGGPSAGDGPPTGLTTTRSTDATKVFILSVATVVIAIAVVAWLYFGYGLGRGEPVAKAVPASPAAARFAIATESIPPASPGTAYRHLLEASGGAPPLEWHVQQGDLPPGLMFDAANGVIEGIPREVGDYPVVVAVTDSAGLRATRSLDLRVQMELAVRTRASLPSGVVRQLYQQELRAEGGAKPYFWELAGGALPAGMQLNSDGLLVGRPQNAGAFPFRAQVTDASKAAAAQAFTLRVGAGLTLLSAAELPSSSVGSPYEHRLAAGGGSPPLRWSISDGSLPPGIELVRSSGLLRGQPGSAGRFGFEVMVQDSARASAVQSFQLEVQSALKIATAANLPDANLNRVYSKPLELEGGNWPYRWTLAGGSLPPGLQLDESSGTIRGTPSLGGNYTFDIQVRDAFRATTTQRFRLAVTTMLEILTAYDLPEALGSGMYSQTLRAGGGRPPYLWKIVEGSLPKDFTLDSTSGVLSGVPTVRGEYRFTVEVGDGLGTKANRLLRLSVVPALRFNDRGTLPAAISGEHYTQALEVSGGQPPNSWTVAEGGLPDGVTLDAATGVVEGTPQTPGKYRFAVQVADAKQASARQFFELQVKPPAPGEMVWHGNLAKDGVLIIQDGRYASVGTVTGALPGVPIKIDLEPKDGLTVVTAPARANNWKVLVINASQPQTEIIIRWSTLSSQ